MFLRAGLVVGGFIVLAEWTAVASGTDACVLAPGPCTGASVEAGRRSTVL